MPGHKLGRGFTPRGVFEDPALLDVTELDVTDDLHNPRGPLLEAQELAARAFGAGRTWFLVNGSSCGIFAMIAANCAAGQKILLARDFHYSAYNAMRFARVKPVYMPITITGTDMADAQHPARAYMPDAVLTPDSVERALFEHPDASAIYLTRPGYYGSVCDIEEITRQARRRGIPVLVDEAHGAHLIFSGRLPICALAGGADCCVQSAHKTLPAFTQCAYAHMSDRALSENPARAGRMAEALRAFQTSSPSFIFTAALDYAREYMSGQGAGDLDRLIDCCESFYADMSAAGYGVPAGIGFPSHNGMNNITKNRHGRDITRLVLSTRPVGLSGTETERLLWFKYKIKIEMSDPEHIVMITTVADNDGDFNSLRTALFEIASKNKNRKTPMNQTVLAAAQASGARAEISAPVFVEPDSTPDFIAELHAAKWFVTLGAAEGRVAADIVTPYPPGVPLICPGEIITLQMIRDIMSLQDGGIIIKGIREEDNTISVYDGWCGG